MHPSARRTTRYLIVILVALAACTGSASVANGSSDARLLVKLRAGTPSDTALSLFSAVGARDLRNVSGLDVHVVGIASSRAQSALDALQKNRLVEYAEPDAVLKPQELLPNDPSFPRQFAVAGGAWGWYTTHTTQAWDITKGDPSVIVAILDTGLKTQGLSDYDGQVVTGWSVLNNSTDTSTSAGNHGTYVAGVVGLALANGTGNAGFCPGCKVMPVQVGTDSGAYLSDIANGITWAADHGARVENMSWAGSSSSATLASAVSYARSKGVVLTAAAGNSNCDCPTYPSATPGVIGVAGTTNTDAKQGDSNYGNWVKVAAPEGNMTSWPSIGSGPGYAPVGGTSLAAPVVAGIAGLLFSANPSLSGTQVEQALEASATPVAFGIQYGRVDALAAMNYLGLTDPQPPSAPVNGGAPQILLQTNGDYRSILLSDAPQTGQVLLRGQGSWSGSAPLSISIVQWQRCDATGAGCSLAGSSAKYVIQAADAGYTFRLAVTVKNVFGSTTAYSALSLPVGGSAVSLPPSNLSPPTISGTPEEGQIVTAASGSWSGSPTSYASQWLRCDTAGAACADMPGATGSTYSPQSADVGSTLRVAVTASNGVGSSLATSTATPTVAAAPPPTPIPTSTVTQTFSGSLNPKNPSRTFDLAVGGGVAHAALSFSKCTSLGLTMRAANGYVVGSLTGPSVIKFDANVAAGTYSYEIGGGRCSFTLTVTAQGP